MRILLLAIALVAMAEAASAQPTLSIRLLDLPTEGQRLSTNDTIYLEQMRVQLLVSNMICNREGVFTVGLAASAEARPPEGWTGNNSTISFVFTPSPVEFRVPAGQYATAPYDRTQSVSLAAQPSLVPPGGLEVDVNVTGQIAQAPSSTSECVYSGALPNGQTTSPQFTYIFRRATVDATPTPAPEMPAPSLVAGLAALGLLTWAARRRGG